MLIVVILCGVYLVPQTRAQLNTSITVAFSPGTVTLGQSTTVTATLKHDNKLISGETITFTDAANNVLGTATTGSSGSSSGKCSITVTPSKAGSYSVTATFKGDSTYEASSQTDSCTVEPATATVTVGFGSTGTVTIGDSVNVYAQVSGLTPVDNWPQPTGLVQFEYQRDSGSWTSFGATVSLSDGSADANFVPQNAGTYTFEAIYQGDSNYVSGTKGVSSADLTVNPAVTSTTLSLYPTGTIQLGTSVTATITVTTSAAGTPPDVTGTWKLEASKDPTFTTGITTVDSGKVSGSLQGSGFTTTATWTPTSIGTWYFKATFGGDCSIVNYQSSCSSTSQVSVVCQETIPTTTTTQLSAASSTVPVGQPVTDTAAVTSTAKGTVTGSVNFYVSTDDGATFQQLGTSVTLSNGQARSISYTPTTAGTVLFKATYLGTIKYGSSTSSDEQLTVTAPFVAPEYCWGALMALAAGIGALFVYKRKSLPKLNFKQSKIWQ